MSAVIPITGVPLDYRVPGNYAEILYAQGEASAFAPGREIVVCMPMTSAGAWTANTLYQVRTESVARAGGGAGSPIHRALRIGLRRNPSARWYALPYAASSGGAPATATATATFSGTITAGGTLTLIVAGEQIPVGFGSSATFDSVAAAAVAAVNAKTHLPVTASYSTPTFTLTAKIAGASQGTATIFAINVHAEIEPLSTGLVVALSGQLGSGTAGADGTTTEAANFLAALATIDAVRKYYIATSLTDATSLGHLKTHIVNKSLPRSGLRSVGIAANRQALGAVQTIATGLNYERLAIHWMKNSEHDPAEIAGALAAVIQAGEELHSATNFDYTALNGTLLPHYSDADIPTGDDLSDAINDGISPITSQNGGAKLVMATTTRSKDSTGALDDPRVLERHRVSVTDEWTDTELIWLGLNMAGKRLDNDPLTPDGKIDFNKLGRRKGVITPEGFKPHIRRSLDDFFAAEKLKSIQKSKDSLRVVKTGSRLEVGIDLEAIDLLHQTTIRIAETSEG